MKKFYAGLLPLFLVALLAPYAAFAQPKLVISQIYGAGGNAGAVYNRDYVEIFNSGTVTADLTGLSLQYASATGTGNFGSSASQLVALSGTVEPGKYYLIALASGTNGIAIPTPDAVGTIAMAANAGKVALVSGTTSLGCNGSSTPCDATQQARIIDLAGYGSANYFEGSGAAPAIGTTTAAFRANAGCTDTDNNSADFATAAPLPRNASSPANLCFTPEPILVISQVYGAGGNSGALFNRDYVEIFNRGTGTADLNGLSIQYASATGTGNLGSSAGQLVALSGSIAPGKYYLVGMTTGTNGAATPTPDVTGTIAMAAGAGKVALVSGTTSLGCNGGSAPCNTEQTDRIIDLVGYGNANFFEGAGTAPTISSTLAAFRSANGCVDTDNNNSDFSTAAPNPRNSLTSPNYCPLVFGIVTNSLPAAQVFVAYNSSIVSSGGSAPVTYTVSGGALPDGLTLATNGVISGTPTTQAGSPFSFTVLVTDNIGRTATKSFTLTVNAAPVCNPTTTIAQVQGPGISSPLLASNVTLSGIVTGRKNNGFFVQAQETDSDPNTSEGLFVFTGSTPPSVIQMGNNVCITATVVEYVSSAEPGGRTITELSSPSYFVTSTGNPLPAPVTLTLADLSAAGGLDQLEKYEGMRITVPSLTVAAPTQGFSSESTATSTSNGFFYGVVTGTARPFREPGIQQPLTAPAGAPANVERWDGNPELLGVASAAQPGNIPINVSTGAIVENLTGPLDFLNKYYVIHVDGTQMPAISNQNLSAVPAPAADADELTIATFNLERFFDDADAPGTSDVVLSSGALASRISKVSLGIRNVLQMPDVIGFQEIENLSVLQAIAGKVNSDAVAAALPDPGYVAYLEEGNDPGGIDVGFLVKSTRVQVQSVVQYGKTATFLNPTTGNQDLLNDRPPLVLTATFLNPTGCQPPVPFIAISNHLRSLNGNEDLTDGRVRAKRLAQAEYLAALIQDFQTNDPNAKIISVGDYNAFEFNDGYVDIIGTIKGTPVDPSKVVLPSPVITNPALTNLGDLVDPSNRYSYVFSGSAQNLDHMLVNSTLLASVSRVVPVHTNADFADILRGDFSRPERVSDHDPQIAYFRFAPPPPPYCTITPVLAPGAFTGGTPNQIFLGYGPQSVTLQSTTGNGTAFTYAWSPAAGLSCTDCAAPVFTPSAAGVYTFTLTITNQFGCSSTCEVTICVADVRVPGTNGKKIYVCHSPAGNPANKQQLSVSINAVAAQLSKPGHSTLGLCGTDPCAAAPIAGITSPKASSDIAVAQLSVRVAPNPSSDVFTLFISSPHPEPVNLRVMDASGKVLTSLGNIKPNSAVRTGEGLGQGLYFAEIQQNNQKQVLKLIKTK